MFLNILQKFDMTTRGRKFTTVCHYLNIVVFNLLTKPERFGLCWTVKALFVRLSAICATFGLLL